MRAPRNGYDCGGMGDPALDWFGEPSPPRALTLPRMAAILDGLIECRMVGQIDQVDFAEALGRLGIGFRAKQELLWASRMRDRRRAETDRLKREELVSDEACPDCLQVDGNHTEDCMPG